jgi:uncharacterized membrane protein
MKKNNKNFQDLGAKVSLAPCCFSWVLALALGLSAMVTQADEFRYRYVSLFQAELPPGLTFFFPAAINDSGRIYGTVNDSNNPDISYVAVYKDGVVTTLSPGLIVTSANEGGTVGGIVLTDPVNFFTQAALFRGDQVKLIPRQPGEVSSFLNELNDSGTALVSSFDDFSTQTFILY